jgi:nucleotide-binding universal stress UspA family protein
VDGTPFGEHALPFALEIARLAKATVRIVHVYAPLAAMSLLERFDHDSRSDAWPKFRLERYLAELVERLARVSSVPVTQSLVEGSDIATVLTEAAGGADLVVMATHRRGPLGRLWNGSVADVLMRRLSIPVLFVSGHEAPPDLAIRPRLSRVLISLDGTAIGEQIMEPALALGKLPRVDHTVLRVVPPATNCSFGSGGNASPVLLSDWQIGEEWRYFQGLAKRLGRQMLGVHPRIVFDHRSTATALLDYAKSHDFDLMALASRGHGGVARLLHGSTAERVVRGATMPVLVVRPSNERPTKKVR